MGAVTAMRAPRPTVTDKVRDWMTAYAAIEDELNADLRRAYVTTGGADALPAGLVDDVRAEIHRNERQAAMAAAVLVAGGTRPVPVEPHG